MFYGGFLLFEAVRPRNFAAGTEKSEPRKRNSRLRNFFSEPRIFFSPAPFFSDGGLEALFPAIWNFFTDKSPMSICRHKPRPAYASRQSWRGNSPHPRQKESLCPLFADIWVSARSARLRFLRPPPPLAPYKQISGPSNDKVSNTPANSKMSNPSQRIGRDA